MNKNCIYQYWVGDTIPNGTLYSSSKMKEYAEKIGADYIFDFNPNIASKMCDYPIYYEVFNPLIDKKRFGNYDQVLSLDSDIYPTDTISRNIFEEYSFDDFDLGICEEEFQPEYRAKVVIGGGISSKNDDTWDSVVKKFFGGPGAPRTKNGKVRVFNTGVLLFKENLLQTGVSYLISFQKYLNVMRQNKFGSSFYLCDQPYLHAMMFCLPHLRHKILSNDWNSFIHGVREPDNSVWILDTKTQTTQFVHIQLRGADNFSNEQLHKVTNLPKEKWDL